MRKKSYININTNVDVDVDVEIYIDDIISNLDQLDSKSVESILNACQKELGVVVKPDTSGRTLNDNYMEEIFYKIRKNLTPTQFEEMINEYKQNHNLKHLIL